MSYTSVELLSQRLISTVPVSDEVHDQPIVMRGTDYHTFYGGAVDVDSVHVKTIRQQELTCQSVLLSSS